MWYLHICVNSQNKKGGYIYIHNQELFMDHKDVRQNMGKLFASILKDSPKFVLSVIHADTDMVILGQ